MEDKWMIRIFRPGFTPGTVPSGLRLYCLPFAGGGASVYRNWGAALGGVAEVWAVQMPGREERIKEPRFYSIDRLVTALLSSEKGKGRFDGRYMLFGHSMGAKIVYEMARRLEELGKPPAALIVSGIRPVNLPPLRKMAGLPDDVFDKELMKLEGTPAAILADEEFMAMYRPLLRADFTLAETYVRNEVLGVPLLAFAGEHDCEVNEKELAQWADLTSGDFGMKIFPGDHFFLKKDEPAFLKALRYMVQKLTNGQKPSDAVRTCSGNGVGND